MNRLILTFVLGLLAVTPPAARAATRTWAVDADGNWSTSGNWSGGTVADGVGNDANFTNNITATRTVTLDTARTISNLTFSDNGAAGSSWVLSGPNTLTLDRPSGVPTITAATNVKISTVLAGNDGLTRSGAGVLELTGANTYSGNTSTGSGGDLRAIDGVGLPSGSPLLLSGTATFQSSGTFTRALGTGAGQVRLTSGGFSAFGGPLALQIGGNTNPLTWASTANFVTGTLTLSSASADSLVDFQNGLNLNAGLRIVNVVDNASSTSDLAQISGPISGSTGTLARLGTGTLILTGANSYENTSIATGTLQIGNGGTTGTLGTGTVSLSSNTTLAFNRSDALSITNTISGISSSSIAQNGTGTTTLSGNMSGGGNVQVNRGTLVLGYGTFNTTKVGDSAVLTIGSVSLVLSGGSHQEVVGSTTINGAASISRSSGTATLRLNALTMAAGASLDLSLDNLADTDTTNTNGVLPGVTVGGNLAKNFSNAADGQIRALAAGDYTQVNRLGGLIATGAATNVKIVSGGTVGNVTTLPAVTTTVNTLSQNATDGAAVVDIGALGTLRLGATGSIVVPSGSNALTFNGGTLTAGGADNTAGTLLFLNAASDVTVNSAIADNGSGAVGVSKSGAGVLTLATANSHTGKTAVNGGTLVIADENRLGSNPAALAADQLSINGATLRTTANFAIDDANRGVTLGGGGGTFQTDPGTTLTVASAMAGTTAQSALTKTGAGTLVLAGSNTYAGGTTISTGTLQVGAGGTSGALGSGDVTNNAALVFNRSDTLAAGNSIGGSGSLTKLGAGTLTLTGNNSYTGGTTLSAGTVNLGSANAISTTGAITFGGGTLQYSAVNTSDYSSRFSNAAGQQYKLDTNGQSVSLGSDLTSSGGALTKLGAGTLVLAGNNSYTGGTTLAAGTLNLGSANAIGTTGTIGFGGGTLQFSAANTTDYSSRFSTAAGQQYKMDTNGLSATLAAGLTSSGGSLTKSGAGTLSANGASTYAGATTVSGGTLKAGVASVANVSGAFGNNSAVTLANVAGAALDITGFHTQIGSLTGGGASGGNVTLGAATLTVGGDHTSPGAFAGILSGIGGGLTKIGTGTQTLTGANTYSGNTTVHAGTVKLDLSGSIDNSPLIIVGDIGSVGAHLDVTSKTGGFTVGAAQTLKGIGQIDGNTSILGAHSPGNSPGLQPFAGNLAYSTGSMLNWELIGNVSTDSLGVRGLDFDGIDVTGAGVLSISTGVTSNLIFNGAGSTVVWSDAFWNSDHDWLVYGNGNAPTLSAIPVFSTINVSTDSLAQTLGVDDGAFSWQQSGNDVYLEFTAANAAVPEPGTYGVLTALGLVAVGVWRRRRS